jgi:ketosteroid isomerase-like protein
MRTDDELAGLVIELYRAMSSGDADRVEAFYSRDPLGVFVGTDEAEFWTDPVRHDEDVRPFFDGSMGPITWKAGGVSARSDGDLGWTIDRPTLTTPDGSELRPRVTLVWRREADGWRVVHSHASFGTP